MRFWDSSALVLLALEHDQPGSASALYEDDEDMAAWWGTVVECASAAARIRRERRIDVARETAIGNVVNRLRAVWLEIEPSEDLRHRAMRLLRVHTLRAGDALQLAAALGWAGSEAGRGFVTRDHRLADAARKEGFDVLIPAV